MIQVLGILVAIATLVCAIGMLWRPQWAAILVLILWAFEQLLQSYIDFLVAHAAFINFAVAGLAGLALVMQMSRGVPIFSGYSNRVTWLTITFYVYWMIGCIYSPAPLDALHALREGLPYMILLLGILPLLNYDVYDFRRMLTGLMVVGTVVSVLIIVNPRSSYYAGRLTLDLGMVSTRDRGSPLAIAEMGGLIALVAALVRPVAISATYTILRIVAFISGFGLAIGSGSRGQVLAAGIAGVVCYPLARRVANPKQFFINVLGFSILIGGIFLTFRWFIGDQNRERWDLALMLRDTTLRLEAVWQLFDAYLASPANWLQGLGTRANATITGSSGISGNYVHNVIAEALCENGLIGASLFAAIAYSTFTAGKRLWRRYQHDPPMRAAVAVAAASCLYSLFLALKQGSLSYPAPFFWWMILAKLSAHEERVAPWDWHEAALSPDDDEQSLDEAEVLEPVAVGEHGGNADLPEYDSKD